ncbi:MAG: polysaccharide biosynthesis tyrosine autokinase, partial [Planctomycetia bacterium]
MDERTAVIEEHAARDGMEPGAGTLVVRDRPPILYQPAPAPLPASSPFDPFGGGIDSLRMLHALRRRCIPAAVLGVLAALACATPVWMFMPRGYEAVVWLRVRDKGGMLSQERDTAEYEAYKKTQLQLMKSPNVLQAALRKPGIEQLETLQEAGADQTGWISRSLVVTAVPESEVVQVRLRGKKPDDVAKILNSVTNAFLDDVVNKERTERLGRRDALEKKFKENMTELRNRRDVLNNLARTLGTRDSNEVANQRALLMDHVTTLRGLIYQTQRTIAAIDAELSIADARDRGEISAEDSVSDEAMDAALIADPQIAELSARLVATDEAIAFQAQRSARGGSEPAVRRLRAQSEDLRERINLRKRELRPAVATRVLADSSLRGVESPTVLRKRREMLAKTLEDTTQEFEKISKEATELGKANADMDARKVELEHLQRVTDQIGIELESSAIDLNMPNRVTLIEPASVPHGGDRVLRILVTLLAGLAGLVLGGGSIVTVEYLQDRVSTAEDLGRRVGTRVLGSYPLVTRLQRRADQAELMAERSDTLRALVLQSGAESPRVILVTSAMEGEGKTTAATQLAASLARADRRTLLIDGDLRHPTAHVPLQLEMRGGFPELLRGELGNDEAVQPTTIEGLFMVTGGVHDYAAVSALSRPELGKILKGYRDSFDHIVIDSSPVLDVSDALMLAQQSDVVVLSAVLDVSRVPQVTAAVDRLRSVGARLLGAVIHGGGVSASRRRATK